ncbi:MAG: helix-turn-helix transcriptional regulator [Bacteroidetes bacterium]|uniref:Helix-turn-helix transcriptional regulator n=1 Tax=Candidatus Cryptobacteroides gallistercoris TaxID=2840765 RepID=A0A940IG38_9BACT|nr:helix-turn-helix transcriptional regulator [Candidatus Cryptobacteroides gallistercoris]
MDKNSVKENLLKMRSRLGLSQEAMAEKLGISRTAYRNIETGKTKLISNHADKIASILGITTEELLLGHSTEERPAASAEDIREKYESRIRDIETGHSEEVTALAAQIKVLTEFIETLKETIRTKDEIIAMLRKSAAAASKK